MTFDPTGFDAEELLHLAINLSGQQKRRATPEATWMYR